MNKNLKFVKKSLYPISYKLSEIKVLSKILFYSIENSGEEINNHDIATLAYILLNQIKIMHNKLQKLEVKLKM